MASVDPWRDSCRYGEQECNVVSLCVYVLFLYESKFLCIVLIDGDGAAKISAPVSGVCTTIRCDPILLDLMLLINA